MNQTHRYREQASSGDQCRAARGRERVGIEDKEVQTDIYKLQGYFEK